jgi:hypothetical protein
MLFPATSHAASPLFSKAELEEKGGGQQHGNKAFNIASPSGTSMWDRSVIKFQGFTDFFHVRLAL